MDKSPENFQEHIVSLPDFLDNIFPDELCMVGLKRTDGYFCRKNKYHGL